MSDYEQLKSDQERNACEMVYAALEAGQHGDAILTWFVEQLKYPKEWAAFVFMALMDKNKRGVLRWREARRPFGLISKITWTAAMKWRPELLFGTEIDLRAKKAGRVEFPSSGSSGSSDDGDSFSDSERQDNAVYAATGGRYFLGGAPDGGDGREYDYADTGIDLRPDYGLCVAENALDSSWLSIENYESKIVSTTCRSLGFDADEIEVMVWRSVHGLSRQGIKEFWDAKRVERVWRRVYEKVNAPDFRLKFTRELHQTIERYRTIARWDSPAKGK